MKRYLGALLLTFSCLTHAQVLDRKENQDLRVQNKDHGYITLTQNNSKKCTGDFHDVWADDSVLHKKVHGCWRYDPSDDTVVILTDDKRGFVYPMSIFHPIQES